MKQITVLIDEDGNSSVDLTGFTDGSCARTMKDFQGDDQLVRNTRSPNICVKHRNKKKSV
jgi:hypothetical protein